MTEEHDEQVRAWGTLWSALYLGRVFEPFYCLSCVREQGGPPKRAVPLTTRTLAEMAEQDPDRKFICAECGEMIFPSTRS